MTQAEQLLAVLADGEYHTTAELLRAVPSIIHSRISDLRAAGNVIEHRTTGTGASGSEYRLLSPLNESLASVRAAAGPSPQGVSDSLSGVCGDSHGTGGNQNGGHLLSGAAHQRTLFEGVA